MKLDKSVIKGNIISFLIFGLFGIVLGLTGVGLIALIMGVIDTIAGLGMLIASRKTTAATYLLCGGILLLIGFSLCSAFPLRLGSR